MYFNAKARAEKQGLPFTIQGKHIAIPNFCPILGIPIRASKIKCSDNSPSLDRILADEGYVPGNVWVVSLRANTLKNNGKLHELRNVMKWANENIKETTRSRKTRVTTKD